MKDTFVAQSRDFDWLEAEQSGWQFGEQGVLLAIYQRLAGEIGSAAEIGAGDGESLPVTLTPFAGRIGLDLYEKDAISRVKLASSFATVYGEWRKINVVRGYDLVVIDVDSFDWFIFADFVGYGVKCPAVIMCEHRDIRRDDPPGCLPSLQKCLSGEQATMDQLRQLATGKMTLIGTTRCNSVFVRDDLLERVKQCSA